jgi:hypothetical protein
MFRTSRSPFLTAGWIFMILASLSKWFLHRIPNVTDGWADGITGFLYGIAIGTLLLGIWRKSRRRNVTDSGTCV